MSKIKKRFVAGAKCPKCGAQDSILLFKLNGIETVECTDCDYTAQQVDEQAKQQSSGSLIGVFKPE
ncbi:YheV family putative zinc ribbon protein [Shewanella intestini]|nr:MULTISPECIES: YheV family putative zinc ribbon protein [Shewanella]MRG35133.1 YheV family putative metal-binding protein [Shewanella sp. XMDDZSB0408]